MLVGLGQRALSERYKYWAHGAGYGVVNLAMSRPPSHKWTYAQDIAVDGFLVFFCSQTHLYRTAGIVLSAIVFLALLHYTWICQRKYAYGSAIQFRGS